LLPDHLAAHFPSTLAEIERVVETVESATSLEAVADTLRPDPITLPSALRWIGRRVVPVRAVLVTVIAMLPQVLLGCTGHIGAVRARLGCAGVLERMRRLGAEQLQALSSPLGFRRRLGSGGESKMRFQQPMGRAPP
jgi:hypothetical protein